MHRIHCMAVSIATAVFSICSAAQSQINLFAGKAISASDSITVLNSGRISPALLDSATLDSIIDARSVLLPKISGGNFRPVVFDTYHFHEPLPLAPDYIDPEFGSVYGWLDNACNSDRLVRYARQTYEVNYPQYVSYNQAWLPEIPKIYKVNFDPESQKLNFSEIVVEKVPNEIEVNRDLKRWIHSFDASLQFSQAYISPNWYQGGNNNLNMIGHVIYNVKLNQKFYPKYLFDFTAQYKIGLNNAPNDSIHDINITEDIFQINATMGLKAARRWYYSANIMFKTQLLHSYPANSYKLKSAFMSPGELNVGVGMTYNRTNKKKTFTFGVSISPVSWNMKTCLNHSMDPVTFDIANGRRVKNKFGSSVECTMEWRIAYNIMYHSRLFAFTDYDYMYADWENTIDFAINRFLSTRLNVNMRYDTSTPNVEGSSWHKFQLKEIFSFGFSFHFGTV